MDNGSEKELHDSADIISAPLYRIPILEELGRSQPRSMRAQLIKKIAPKRWQTRVLQPKHFSHLCPEFTQLDASSITSNKRHEVFESTYLPNIKS